MVRFWPKRCHRMPRSLYPAVVLQPEKMPIAFKFVTCRVGGSSVQQIFFISTRDALKGVLPVHVLSESLLCANFLSVPCIIVWNALHVIFMCILYPLPDFQAVRFSDVWPGLRKTIRIAAVWSLNIIELFRKMSAHLLSIRWGGIL